MKKALKRKGSGEKRNLEESALSIAAQLYCWLGQDFSSGSNGNNKSGDAADKAYPARLLNKLTEREHEKLERCVELYGECVISFRSSYFMLRAKLYQLQSVL
jgi:hypothetical protein